MWPKYAQKPSPVDTTTTTLVMGPDGLSRPVPRGWVTVSPTDIVMPCDMAAYKSSQGTGFTLDFIQGRDYNPSAFLHLTSKSRYEVGLLKYAEDHYLVHDYVLFLRDVAHYSYIMSLWKPAGAVSAPPYVKDTKKLDTLEEKARKEKAAELKFFFGCKPSDPDKLPPPPKVLGMTWDELAEY